MNIRKWLVIYVCNMHCRLSKIYLLVLFMDNFQTQQFLTHSIYVKKVSIRECYCTCRQIQYVQLCV